METTSQQLYRLHPCLGLVASTNNFQGDCAASLQTQTVTLGNNQAIIDANKSMADTHPLPFAAWLCGLFTGGKPVPLHIGHLRSGVFGRSIKASR